MGRCNDYIKHRIEEKQLPISFRLVDIQAIHNPSLQTQFEQEHIRLSKLTRKLEELHIWYGFHGTRESNLLKIAILGLLRSKHPSNSSPSTDAGWFGSTLHGVHLSRHSDYALKYSNDLAPLDPSESVKIILFKTIPGGSKHLVTKTVGLRPSEGYDSHSSPQFLRMVSLS